MRALIVSLMVASVWLIVPARGGELPSDVLAQLYHSGLGDQYDSAQLPRLFAVHELLEKYFAASPGSQQTEIARRIDAVGLDRSIVGRLARLRMGWTNLTPGVYYINTRAGPLEVRYFLGIPRGYDLTKSWPLVVKLPEANAFLTDPPPDAKRVTEIYSQWITDELSDHSDAMVLMPLLNLDELYGPGPVGMDLVMQPILDAAGRANIDPARVYLIGHSMAASAVWNLSIHYPTYFTAINPMAGSMHDSWQRYRLPNLENILCIVWHDGSDQVTDVNESREIVGYLRRMQYDVDYTETQTAGHRPPPAIVEQEYRKLRTRTRDLYPAEVFIQSNNAGTVFNRADWVQIYQPMSPGQQARVEFSRGSQGMYLYEHGFRVIARIMDRHTISMATNNVRLVRIYLNDQMVDLDHPLKITANGLTRFDGIAPQSTEQMLKDQVFLGRGWRYFTAQVDLDLSQPPVTRPE